MNEIVIKVSDELLSFVYRNGFVPSEKRDELNRAILECVELPKGHGRLIDIDKAVENEETFRKYFSITTHPLMNGKIINCVAPSVIEADKGEE